MNILPKTVTRQRRDCDLNPGPSAPESSRLTTRLSSHPVIIVGCVKSKPMTAMTAVSVGVTIGNMTGHLPPGLLSPRPTHRRRQLPRVTANSHRHARHDKTVLSVSRQRRRCELDSRQLKTVADRKSEVRTRPEQSSNSHRNTRHDADRTVLSCLAGGVNWALGFGVTGLAAATCCCDVGLEHLARTCPFFSISGDVPKIAEDNNCLHNPISAN